MSRSKLKPSSEQTAVIGLHTPKIGSKTLFALRSLYGSYEKAYQAYQMKKLSNLTDAQKISLAEHQPLLPRIVQLIDQYDIKIVLYGDPDYPSLLSEMTDPPAVLYVRGSIGEHQRIAIVGSRRSTPYGLRAATDLASEAAKSGINVVSGLALGIDAAAHKGALVAGGQTIGILACGVEQIYPASHRQLALQTIKQGGALVSEFPLLTPPYRGNFLVRNRLIAAFTPLTVVIEAAPASGALVTARLALDYNRDVWALPGDIYRESSIGPNQLIASGATPFIGAGQLADYFNVESAPAIVHEVTPDDQLLLSAISKTGTHIDDLAEALSLDIAATNSRVILLELKGLVVDSGAGIFRRVI